MSFAHEFCTLCLSEDCKNKKLGKTAEISLNAFSKLIADCNVKITTIQSSYNDLCHREIFEFFSLVVEVSL